MRDSGSIVLGWLTKLAVTLAVLGLLAFDGIALVTTTFSATDQANAVASVAAETYKRTHDVQMAYNDAVTEAAKNNETVEAKTFQAQPTDGHITLRIHKKATTLWLHKVGFLKKYADITATGEATPAQ